MLSRPTIPRVEYLNAVVCKRQVPAEHIIQYKNNLTDHIWAVINTYKELFTPVPDHIFQHDESKWSKEEFPHYVDMFMTGKKSTGFVGAWLHHIHNNPHHWKHWMFPGRDDDSSCVFMPEIYVNEMIADWIGASKVYEGVDNIAPWLTKNYGIIRLHPESRIYLIETLHNIGVRDFGE